jgi:hypothetical protein
MIDLPRKANARGIVIAPMADQTRQPSVRWVIVTKVGIVYLLALCQRPIRFCDFAGVCGVRHKRVREQENTAE